MPQIQILMVDNSTATAKIFSKIIEKEIADCFVTTCKTASEAIELCEEKNFNIITSALILPDMSGLELAKQLKNHAQCKTIPFVLISSNIDDEIVKQGFEVGITAYFDKAKGHSALIKCLEVLIPKQIECFNAKILYVEDSPTAALRLKRIFKSYGFKIEHVDTAERAYTLLIKDNNATKPAYDIVVTDIILNGAMTGFDLAQIIRGRLHYSLTDLPIIITSAENADIDRVFEVGANDFIAKPVHEKLICVRIQGLLAIRDQQRQK